ncbi:MAG: hypothetical protein MO853_11905 [Candidatus Protistobacter heckmanni]|nr:hypothetical protein [Candidatus Protistobacter heckmanni]
MRASLGVLFAAQSAFALSLAFVCATAGASGVQQPDTELDPVFVTGQPSPAGDSDTEGTVTPA